MELIKSMGWALVYILGTCAVVGAVAAFFAFAPSWVIGTTFFLLIFGLITLLVYGQRNWD